MGNMANKLTIKQEKFAQGLFAGLSQSDAYKQAFNAENMSDAAIYVEACNLAASPKVALRVEQLTNELKERNMVTVERVLAELAKIGFADIKDFISFRTAQTVVDHKDGEPVVDYAHVVEMKDSDQVDGTLISEVQLKDGTLKFKLHDKLPALEKIGKHLGMFSDKLELTGKDGGPITVKLEDFFSK